MLKNFLLSSFAVCGATLIVMAAVAADSTTDSTNLSKPAAEAALPAAEAELPAEASSAESSPKPKSAPTPLSVEPGVGPSTIFIPPGRPAWVESPADHKSEIHTVAVSSSPHARRADCLHALDAELDKAVAEYIEEHLGVGSASKLVHYDLRTIKNRLVGSDQYEEDIEISIGPMHQVHALLKFDAPFRAELDQRWYDIKAKSRLLQTGLFGGSILGILALVFGYLKLDTATRGYYTGRLQFGAVAAVLGLAAAGVFLARWIPWM